MRCGNGGIDVGLTGAVVAGDADIVGRAVAQYLLAGRRRLSRPSMMLGQIVGGDGGRCSCW